MARMKFLCDADRCIECNACVTACKNEHEVPWGINRRRVVTINDGLPGERSVSMACMHCTDAPCAAVCPVNAFYTTDDAVVLHSKDTGGGFASGGQDGRVAVWPAQGIEPRLVTQEHQAPIAGLALSPDGATLAAGGWDGRLQFISPETGDVTVIDAHRGAMVTGLGYFPDGRLVTVGSDQRLVIWQGTGPVASIGLPASPNKLAMAGDRVAVIFADGAIRLFDMQGLVGERRLGERPITAIAADRETIAAASVAGDVWVLEAGDLAPRHALKPGQGPIWSLAVTGNDVLTGGGDDGLIRRWDAATGKPLGTGAVSVAASFDDGSRGAEIWRACALCHSLEPNDGNRAGPTLLGLFGRRIATAANYAYSKVLRGMDIVWTPETVAELFEVGPEAYTPGSRMPDQRVPAPEDRAALVEFLAPATR